MENEKSYEQLQRAPLPIPCGWALAAVGRKRVVQVRWRDYSYMYGMAWC